MRLKTNVKLISSHTAAKKNLFKIMASSHYLFSTSGTLFDLGVTSLTKKVTWSTLVDLVILIIPLRTNRTFRNFDQFGLWQFFWMVSFSRLSLSPFRFVSLLEERSDIWEICLQNCRQIISIWEKCCKKCILEATDIRLSKDEPSLHWRKCQTDHDFGQTAIGEIFVLCECLEFS